MGYDFFFYPLNHSNEFAALIIIPAVITRSLVTAVRGYDKGKTLEEIMITGNKLHLAIYNLFLPKDKKLTTEKLIRPFFKAITHNNVKIVKAILTDQATPDISIPEFTTALTNHIQQDDHACQLIIKASSAMKAALGPSILEPAQAKFDTLTDKISTQTALFTYNWLNRIFSKQKKSSELFRRLKDQKESSEILFPEELIEHIAVMAVTNPNKDEVKINLRKELELLNAPVMAYNN